MPAKVWIDGTLVDKTDAKVSVLDHGLLFGDGVWAGMRVYAGRVFRLADHLARLAASADAIALKLPLSRAEMAAAVRAAVAANARAEGYVRVTVTRGPGTLGLDPRKCEPAVVILADDVGVFPRELAAHGVDLVTAATRRPHPGSFPPGATLLSHAHAVLAKVEALKAGCLDALVLTPAGDVAGTVEGAIFVVTGGAIATPPAAADPPDPVMRAAVLDLAREAGIPAGERPLAPADVAAADEAFVAGTAAEVIAVARLDGRPVGAGREGPVTRRVRDLFREVVRRPGPED